MFNRINVKNGGYDMIEWNKEHREFKSLDWLNKEVYE
jgi:hypothetical protein